MKKEIRRSEIKYVDGVNDLCNCSCNLLITNLFERHTINKCEEYNSKFSANNHLGSEIGAYCKECNNLYYIHIMYEASSKTDWEEIRTIEKVNYFDNMMNFKGLRSQFENDNTFTIYVDGINITILKVINNEKLSKRIIYYYVVENDMLALNNLHKKCCYKCDGKSFVIDSNGIASQVECEQYGYKAFDDICEDYYTFYEEDEEYLPSEILTTEEEINQEYNTNLEI